MTAVAAWDDGFVAVGNAGDHAAIWTSLDGARWSRVEDSSIFHEPTSISDAMGVVATAVAYAGEHIAVVGNAYAQAPCTPGRPARLCPGIRAWWSSDGASWERAAFEKPKDGQLDAMTASPSGYLIVGWSAKCDSGVWTSTDGSGWVCQASGPAPRLSTNEVAIGASPTRELILGRTCTGMDEERDPTCISHAWYRTLRP
jgi:hypothetical protein